MASSIKEEPVYRREGSSGERTNQEQGRWVKEEAGQNPRGNGNRGHNSSSYKSEDQHPSKHTSNVSAHRNYGGRGDREGQSYRGREELRREDTGRYDSRDTGNRGRPSERNGSDRSERRRSRSREPLPDRARYDTDRKHKNLSEGNRQKGGQPSEQNKLSTPLDKQNTNSKERRGSSGEKDPLQETEYETDPRRLEQRQKQIDYGKNTLGYDNYVKAVPKDRRRGPDQPHTPDKHKAMSKRTWDGVVKAWRRALHKFDPTGGAEPAPANDHPATAKEEDSEELTIVPMSELEAMPFDVDGFAGGIESEEEEVGDMDIFGSGGGVGGDLYDDVMDDQ